ncbi:MAG TPA: hypothetical protein VL493_01785 [Candidatus Saccharimonadales bacterium]|nr:hypothetical protein [Candidatus Saccharimonadales bacterium]
MTADRWTTRDLSLAYLASTVVAVLMTVASAVGLISGSSIYAGPDAKLLPLFVGQDALNILVGLPVLLGSMWLARRGSLIGLLLWPGALFYVLYDYGYYALGAPFNWFFVPYLVLVAVSAYAMIAVVVSIDGGAVRDRLAGTVRARSIGGFLGAVAVLFMALWTAMSVSALAGGTSLDPVARTVTIMDLTVQLPALLLGGVLLWRRHSFGYVVAPGLLLQAAAYLIGLSTLTVLQELLIAAPIDPVAVAPGLVIGAVGLMCIATFVREAAVTRRPDQIRPTTLAASAQEVTT